MSNRKATEQALKENEYSYRQFFMSTPVVCLIIDPATGNILDANRAAVSFYGYTANELRTMAIFEMNVVAPEEIRDYLSNASKDYCKPVLLRHKLKDGSLRDVEVYSGPVRIREKTMLFSVIIDVTARKQAEEELRESRDLDITDHRRTEELFEESEKRLRGFAEAVPDTSFIIDEDGRYVEVFGSEKMFHIPKEQFRGHTTHQVLQKNEADFILNEVRQAIASGKQRTGFHIMILGSEKRYFSGRTVPLNYMIDGKRTAAVIVTDVTERVTYELRHRSDLINDVLNGTAATDEDLAYVFNQLGLEISSPQFACKLLSDKFDFGDRHPQIAGISSIQRRKDGVIVALNEIPDCIAWDCREGIGVLCRATFGTDKWERSKEIAALIRTKLLEYDSSIAVYVGVSDIYAGIKGLKKSCRQALSAALAARCRAAEGVEIVHYREAGIFQFIPEPLGGDAAKEYIEQHIGRLIAYDQAKQANYLTTLEEILRGASVRETADRQFIHPKIVVFRQKRISKILSVDLNDYQTRLALAIALQLYKLNNI